MPDTTENPAARPAMPPADDSAPDVLAVRLAAVVGRLLRKLRTESAESLLTPSQRSVLARLESDGPATTAALARAEYVRPQSMRLTLAALESQALVDRAPDPEDGRKSLVSVNDAGRATLAGLRAAKHDWLTEALTAEWDEAERQAVAEAVTLLGRLVER
ncbi:MarR family winged helix-turn-helix transcriptional regulator [Streptomyces sp. NPDC005576]|uniref:MarR family winged helix-turn-helix transcriptional regulator n=1 Tax=Streptomyces sp. NPDC005576 TaxID=3364726 RepID=UPI0036C7ADFD